MGKSKKKDTGNTIKKEDFIDFLASATPDEINALIRDKGKPPKLIEPMIFFKDRPNTQVE